MYAPPTGPLSAADRKAESRRYVDSYAQALAGASAAERELALMEMSDAPTNWARKRHLEEIVRLEKAAREAETHEQLKTIAALPQRATADTPSEVAVAIAVRVARAALAGQQKAAA